MSKHESTTVTPDIIILNEETKLPPLGIWGRMRYADLKLSGELYAHCYETETIANSRKEFMMRQAIAQNPISEYLKNTDPLRWVGHMNALKQSHESPLLIKQGAVKNHPSALRVAFTAAKHREYTSRICSSEALSIYKSLLAVAKHPN